MGKPLQAPAPVTLADQARSVSAPGAWPRQMSRRPWSSSPVMEAVVEGGVTETCGDPLLMGAPEPPDWARSAVVRLLLEPTSCRILEQKARRFGLTRMITR